jgi:hypothetical protein
MFRCSGHGADETMWTVGGPWQLSATHPSLVLPPPSARLPPPSSFQVPGQRNAGEGVRAAVHEREGKDGSKARDGLKEERRRGDGRRRILEGEWAHAHCHGRDPPTARRLQAPSPPRRARPMSRPVAVPPICAIAHFHPAVSLGAAWAADSGERCVQAQGGLSTAASLCGGVQRPWGFDIYLLSDREALPIFFWGHFWGMFLSPVPSTESVVGCRSRDTASTTAIHERTGRLDGIQNRSVGAQRHCCRLFFLRRTGYGGEEEPSSHRLGFWNPWGAPTHHSPFPSHCTVQPTVPLLPPYQVPTRCPGPGPGLRADRRPLSTVRRPSAFRRRSLHSSSLSPRFVPFPPSTYIHPETTHRQTRRLSWSSSPSRRAHCPRPCPSTSSTVFDSVPTRGSFFGSLCVFVLLFPDPAFPSE